MLHNFSFIKPYFFTFNILYKKLIQQKPNPYKPSNTHKKSSNNFIQKIGHGSFRESVQHLPTDLEYRPLPTDLQYRLSSFGAHFLVDHQYDDSFVIETSPPGAPTHLDVLSRGHLRRHPKTLTTVLIKRYNTACQTLLIILWSLPMLKRFMTVT